MINLMQGDCLERMKEIPSGSVDMILTDPPYELSKSKGGGMMGKGGRKFMEEVNNADMVNGINTSLFLDACLSIFEAKQYFCGVFTCSNKQIVEYLNWAEQNNLQYGVGVWNKTNPAPLCNFKYLGDVEYWIYIKGNKSKILGSYKSKSMVYTSKINKEDKSKFNHPTCKPVDLMEKFIINHSTEGQVILDPFMGSGSAGVAAKNLNRNFIGIELDQGYFNTAKERIENA
ncbi:adenine-specific DNA methyltransferase [Pseudoalteromonas phage H103]|uniref:DNA methyltransferase n=1 Tax=Pseudoalteromonas phage H103 TaxID=1636200 RepID=UPI0006BCE2E9|nr:DNA methyltransferase [Pseudoalteromonas phage H103]AKA61251.1 adenine-specific DNA methyltransferase [Pseudoalteromonas phage H103]